MPMPENGPVLRYFAYGSNMLLARLRERTPSAVAVGRGVLAGHRLAFHKVGRDGSGKCDIHAGDAAGSVVHGVLFHLHPGEKAALDEAEGLGRGYGIRRVEIETAAGRIQAFSYYATRIEAGLRPFHWYRDLVLAGAREHGLPERYIDRIAAVPAVADPDPARSRAAERLLAAGSG